MSHISTQELKDIIPKDDAPIYHLEKEILKFPQVNMPVKHDFCDGIYARTMHIPAGTILTGAIHREESFFLVRKGELIVTTDNGLRIIGAGEMSVSQIGTKRAGIALTDVDVTTFHANPTNEQEPQSLWDMFTIPAPITSIEAVCNQYLE
jgi:hypothetical protein